MASIKDKPKKAKGGQTSAIVRPMGSGLALPKTYANLGVTSGPDPLPLEKSRILLMSKAKVGKTTFLGGIPRCLIVDIRQGSHSIKKQRTAEGNHRVEIKGWDHYMDVMKTLKAEAKAKNPFFNMVAIDVGGEWQKMIETHLLQKFGVESLDEVAHGKGWDRLRETGVLELFDLNQLGYGYIVTAHLTPRFIRLPDGSEREVVDIAFRGSFKQWIHQEPELICTLSKYREFPPKLDNKGRPMKTSKGLPILDTNAKKVAQYLLEAQSADDSRSGGSRVEIDEVLELDRYSTTKPWRYGWDILKEAYDEACTDLVEKWS